MVFRKEAMKIFIFSFFLLPFSFLFSQGNLQFNQVLTPDITISGSISINAGVGTVLNSSGLTVPSGKVWKIESIFAVYNNYFACTSCSGSSSSANLSNINLTMQKNGVKARPHSIDKEIIENNAIWLKSGDEISFKVTGSGGYNGTYINGSIIIPFSIIEFNIIP